MTIIAHQDSKYKKEQFLGVNNNIIEQAQMKFGLNNLRLNYQVVLMNQKQVYLRDIIQI